MRALRFLGWILAAATLAAAAHAAPMTGAQALAALAQADASTRVTAVERLGEIGTMRDADRVVERLRDSDPRVRESAVAALWSIWGRSGDPAIDQLYARGVEQMQASQLAEALATFDEIVRRKPAFAEGWNKRATIYYLLGQFEKSLADCDQVFERNPHHFGALSGAAQIHLQMGHARTALDFFRRALEVHPGLDGAAQMIPRLERFLRDEDRNRS